MEGDESNKVLSTDKEITSGAVPEQSVDIEDIAFSKSVNRRLVSNLQEQDNLIFSNENCQTEITELESETYKVEDSAQDRIGESRSIILRNGLEFIVTDSNGSEGEVILEPFGAVQTNPLTDHNSTHILQTKTTGHFADNKLSSINEAATSPSISIEDVSCEAVELDFPGNTVLPQVASSLYLSAGDFESTCINGISNKAPEVIDKPSSHSNCEAAVSFISSETKISSSNDRNIYLKLDNAPQNSDVVNLNDDNDQKSKIHIELLKSASGDDFSKTVDMGISVISTKLNGGEDVKNFDIEVPHNVSQLEVFPACKRNTSQSDISEVSSNNNRLFRIVSETTNKVNEGLSSHIIQEPLKSFALSCSSFEAEPSSSEVTEGQAKIDPECVRDGEMDAVQSSVNLRSYSSTAEPQIVECIKVEPTSAVERIDHRDNLYCNQTSSSKLVISDENKNVYGGVIGKCVRQNSFEKISEEQCANTSHSLNGSKAETIPIALSQFVDHREELDYEDNGGEDKNEKSVDIVPRTESEEDGEQVDKSKSDKDEGELSDDDCEEGEIKEPGNRASFVKPLCLFFQKGNCTWGVNCRFLHPGFNDKGNYQMIEIPGFISMGRAARIGTPDTWPEQAEQAVESAPTLHVPAAETAWERGLRLAKEQRKKATERKEQEFDFEDKRLNLSVDEELNKENVHKPKVIPKIPYYDQQVYEEDEYYKIPSDPWQTGRYENSQMQYSQERFFSQPCRDKPSMVPSAQYSSLYGPAENKLERDRQEPYRSVAPHDYVPSLKQSDEWTDPWMRSKSPQQLKQRVSQKSRSKRKYRSISGSHSSRSSSRSSSGSSRSRSSSGSSSRSRSPKPAYPAVDRHIRHLSPSQEHPRIGLGTRGRGGNDQAYYKSSLGNGYQRASYQLDSNGQRYYSSNYGDVGVGSSFSYSARNERRRSQDRTGRKRGSSPPGRPLPYIRPRPRSGSSYSSRSRSRGRGRKSSSRSRSSSRSSRSSRSSSTSSGSADSEHLYRDLGSPSKDPRGATDGRNYRTKGHKKHHSAKKQPQVQSGLQKHQTSVPQHPSSLDQIPYPDDPKPAQPVPAYGKPEPKYAVHNVPPAPVKAKDPLKVVGQKSNIKLTLLPKSSLGSRPNPLDSPPRKRQLSSSGSDISPVRSPPMKQSNVPGSQTSAQKLPLEKAAAKIQLQPNMRQSPLQPNMRQSPLPSSPCIPQPVSSSSSSTSSSSLPQNKTSAPSHKQQQSNSVKPRITKTVPKIPIVSIPTTTTTGAKVKKNTISRRAELLKQLKAVEEAIAKKKSKF